MYRGHFRLRKFSFFTHECPLYLGRFNKRQCIRSLHEYLLMLSLFCVTDPGGPSNTFFWRTCCKRKLVISAIFLLDPLLPKIRSNNKGRGLGVQCLIALEQLHPIFSVPFRALHKGWVTYKIEDCHLPASTKKYLPPLWCLSSRTLFPNYFSNFNVFVKFTSRHLKIYRSLYDKLLFARHIDTGVVSKSGHDPAISAKNIHQYCILTRI